MIEFTYKEYKNQNWNRCEVCGRFIPFADLDSGKAMHRMVTPDTAFTAETYETLYRDHYKPRPTPPPAPVLARKEG